MYRTEWSATTSPTAAPGEVKKQQMRWNRYTVQSFLDVRIQVLSGSLEDAFPHWHKGFRTPRIKPNLIS